MKLEDLTNMYGTVYRAMKEIGLEPSNANYWKRLGYIPITTQLKIEKVTKGKLVASLDDCGAR